jgi:hypothetical protein
MLNAAWMKKEWLRERKLKRRKVFLPFEKKAMQQVTKPGLYWFTDLNEKKWSAHIHDDGTATKIEFGTLHTINVNSLGVGEFIGPLV